MKKTLLLFVLLSTLSAAKASDTLTIGQIFNFDVGDTFDYKYYHRLHPDIPDNGTVSYIRKIIIGKTLFADSVIYVFHNVSSSNYVYNDTMSYGNINSPIYSSYIDTPEPQYPVSDTFSLGISNWDSIYNRIYEYEGDDDQIIKFERGLGKTFYRLYDWSADLPELDTVILIYYAKGSSHAGTPFYNQPTAIQQLVENISIHLYPNPISDILHLSILDLNRNNTHLLLTDLIGREVYSSYIAANETTYDISKLPSGIYTWRLISDGSMVKTGKLVKE